ncbi:MAG: hypothetical protein GEV08_08030 [Acidimicrobiia bacterium]|nr:hypothetical protein [Acidimicrobiia bacterium]
MLTLAWGLVRLGAVVAADAAAQAAADAVALAGALEGRAGAAEVATANDATLVEWHEEGWLVQVVVARRGQRARATAEWAEGEPPGAPDEAAPPP